VLFEDWLFVVVRVYLSVLDTQFHSLLECCLFFFLNFLCMVQVLRVRMGLEPNPKSSYPVRVGLGFYGS
jgi:hypothetical protein